MTLIRRADSMRLSFNAFVIAYALAATCGWAHPGSGIVVLENGDICFTSGNSIVRLGTNGQKTTLIEDKANQKFYQLHHLHKDAEENLYTAADTGSGIWRVTTGGKMSRAYPPPNDDRAVQVGTGGDPFCMDGEQNVWAVNAKQDTFSQVIKMDRHGRILWIAGGDWGHADGKGSQARFGELHGGSFAHGDAGLVYLTDGGRYVRAISADAEVSTLAGNSSTGFADARRSQARFSGAAGLVMGNNGVIFVADSGNHRIRSVAPDGSVKTVAGSGGEGAKDGPAGSATFQEPTGVAVDRAGAVYVLEAAHQRVRKIGTNGMVTTLTVGSARRR